MAIKKSKVNAYKPADLASPQVYQKGLKKSKVKAYGGDMGQPTKVPLDPLSAPNSVYGGGLTPTPSAMPQSNVINQNSMLEGAIQNNPSVAQAAAPQVKKAKAKKAMVGNEPLSLQNWVNQGNSAASYPAYLEALKGGKS